MTNILIMGDSVQGLVSASLLAKSGHKVRVVDFKDTHNNVFFEKYKNPYVAHIPYAFPASLMEDLNLEHHGFDPTQSINNPFKKLPFYDGLLALVTMFKNLDKNRPQYKEKAWRDAWNTFEIGRILAGYSIEIQQLFAKSATVSLFELLDIVQLSEEDKAHMMALCVLGSKTDPNAAGSAFSIISALAAYEDSNSVLIQGDLYLLIRALKLSAMVSGVEFIEDAKINKIIHKDENIEAVILDNQEKITADYFLLDTDPITFFEQFFSDFNLPPAFRNRISPTQHIKEVVGMKIVLSQSDISDGMSIIAPSVEYIKTAKSQIKTEGGSQFPVVSYVSTSFEDPQKNNLILLDIWAQYFDPETLENNSDAIAQAIIQSLEINYPDIKNKIIDYIVHPLDAMAGQPNITGSMPLLQLFKIFSGYHSIGYDTPVANMFIVGYGHSSLSHPHVYDAAVRVSSLLQSD